MSVFGRIFRRRTRLQDERRVRVGRIVMPERTRASDLAGGDLWGKVAEGYKGNAIIYACVRELATSVAEPVPEAIRVTRDNTEVPLDTQHPLVQLLWRPNPEQDYTAFFELLITHYMVAGVAYVHKVRSATGRLIELWLIRPDAVRHVFDSTGLIREYRVRAASDLSSREVVVPGDDIVRIIQPHPLDQSRPLAPLDVAAAAGDVDIQAVAYLRELLIGGGVPNVVISLEGEVPRDERERIKQVYKQEYGSSVAGHAGALVVDGSAKIEALGIDPKRMDISHVFDVSESRICAAFGVPPILIGSRFGLERSTYANYREARKSFWQETLSPLYNMIASRITDGVAKEFGRDLEVRWDFSRVHALQEDAAERLDRAVKGWEAGIMSRNEAREMIGLPPVEGGDILREDLSFAGVPAKPIQASSSNARARSTAKVVDLEAARSVLADDVDENT